MYKELRAALAAIIILFALTGPHPKVAKADLSPTGMAKPVADLRDYNGTASGSPGTGTIGYSTLYRDNKDGGATNRCNGEGCGSHPGVDIPVTSGTNVYASYTGEVVRSECNGSWGGLVVIKSTNPYNSSETIYFTYAHLKERYVSVTSPRTRVTTGALLGKSGGASTDLCRGTSTGAHLHFQIDKNDGNDSPWHPASANTADTNFDVTTKTYNPIVFVTGGYRWTFWQNGNREYWDLFNFSSWSVSGGYLQVDGNYDPYIRRSGLTNCGGTYSCSSSITAEAAFYKKVHLSMNNNCVQNPLKVYFTTANSPTWNEAKSASYNLPGIGSIDTHINMGSNPYWTGIITGLRIDPAVNCNPNASDPNRYYNITVER